MGARCDVIGKSTAKRDGSEKVSGPTPHLHDLALPRMAHAKTPRPKAPRELARS